MSSKTLTEIQEYFANLSHEISDLIDEMPHTFENTKVLVGFGSLIGTSENKKINLIIDKYNSGGLFKSVVVDLIGDIEIINLGNDIVSMDYRTKEKVLLCHDIIVCRGFRSIFEEIIANG